MFIFFIADVNIIDKIPVEFLLTEEATTMTPETITTSGMPVSSFLICIFTTSTDNDS